MRRPYHGKGAKGHVWKRAGRAIDIFGWEGGTYHNGPICVNCGYGFCHHCQDAPVHECPKAKKTKSRRK